MKRTPLTRRSPLKPGKATLPRSRMRRVGKRKERELDAIKAFRKGLIARSGGRCEACGASGHHAHHLVPRSVAGAHKNTHHLLNGAFLCVQCHHAAHSSTDPKWASLRKRRSHLDQIEG